ncbi:MAG: hypothetical protein ACM3N9_03845, partial [Syntrophothermus sp.]
MKKLVFFLLLILSLNSFSQNGWRDQEMEIKVQFASLQEADRFHHFHLDAEQAGPGSVYVYVTPGELQQITSEGFTYQILIQ